MFGLWNRIDYKALYRSEAETNTRLVSTNERLIARYKAYDKERETLFQWVETVCTLVPQLKVRSDKGAPEVKAQLNALVQEAEKKEWVNKKAEKDG